MKIYKQHNPLKIYGRSNTQNKTKHEKQEKKQQPTTTTQNKVTFVLRIKLQ